MSDERLLTKRLLSEQLLRRIERRVDSLTADMLADLSSLIAIKSVTGRTNENFRALSYVLDRAASFGLSTEITPEQDAGHIEMKCLGGCIGHMEAPKTMGILTHVDVVDVGDISKWQTNPFEATVRDGRLYGRGAEDDKCGVMCALYAMRALREECIGPSDNIRLIVGTCEESKWHDIDHYISHFGVHDYGFSPDGSFPVCNEENGYADVSLSWDKGGIENIYAGDSANTIPSFARIRMHGQKEQTFHGKSTHSSEPAGGENAIINMCKSYEPIARLDFAKFINSYFSSSGSQRLFPAKTVAAPTTLRLENERLKMNLNIRHASGIGRAQLADVLQKASVTHSFDFDITEYQEPMYVSAGEPFIAKMSECAALLGESDGIMQSRGTTYAKAMPNTVIWGPVPFGEPVTAHQENESISVKALIRATKIYACYMALT